jgi:elongation factor Ts
MAITAELVKELRKRTGSGMMECKKALVEANGDIELAFENLRKRGMAQAEKKASNIAAEGQIVIHVTPDHKRAIMVEFNCQTDFVERSEDFRNFAQQVASRALAEEESAVEKIAALRIDHDSETIEEYRRSLVAKLGENIQIRRAVIMQSEGCIGNYVHADRIGVLVNLSRDSKELGKDLAMHIVANRPRAIMPQDIPASVVEKEREIFLAQAQGSGKSADVIEKIVEEHVKLFRNEQSLLGQPFVKDTSQTIENLLIRENAKVLAFERFEVGEGIEKKVESFADEVMAQVRGSK